MCTSATVVLRTYTLNTLQWTATVAALLFVCGIILCGVTLVPFTMSFHVQVKEVFGSGTACVVCPVEEIQYLDEVYVMCIVTGLSIGTYVLSICYV